MMDSVLHHPRYMFHLEKDLSWLTTKSCTERPHNHIAFKPLAARFPKSSRALRAFLNAFSIGRFQKAYPTDGAWGWEQTSVLRIAARKFRTGVEWRAGETISISWCAALSCTYASTSRFAFVNAHISTIAALHRLIALATSQGTTWG